MCAVFGIKLVSFVLITKDNYYDHEAVFDVVLRLSLYKPRRNITAKYLVVPSRALPLALLLHPSIAVSPSRALSHTCPLSLSLSLSLSKFLYPSISLPICYNNIILLLYISPLCLTLSLSLSLSISLSLSLSLSLLIIIGWERIDMVLVVFVLLFSVLVAL